MTGPGTATGVRIGRQLAHPTGLGGNLLALVMGVANRAPNRFILDALDAWPGDQILDLGCGDGGLIAQLPAGTRAIGIDHSPTMIAAARRRNQRAIAAGRCRFAIADMRALPVADGSIDRIIASNILYFCNDLPALIGECRRVARDGARLLIYVTAQSSMRHWSFASPATHIHFSEQSLLAGLAGAGIDRRAVTLTRLRLPAGVEGLLADVILSRSA